ncbi:MAG: stage II sporulation protein P [Thermoanaerobacterales bacterium]|nr:stage II sporulation protein P [Bacillota bacterium]MDI6906525.1 stage II sporulation protein P [Thermoanaerobacterales bacterium]
MRWLRVVLLVVLLVTSTWLTAPETKGLARAGGKAAREWGTSHPEVLIAMALPGRGWQGEEASPGMLAREALGRAAGVSLGDAQEILASQLPGVLARRPVVHLTPGPPAKPGPGVHDDGARPLVAIYSTHTGETYALDDGVERFDGRPGGVVDAARELERALAEREIDIVRSERVHDVPYAKSYLKSQKTAEELLEGHPGIDVLIDVHRDSKKDRDHSVVRINGRDAATILFIVGSDARQPFPGWRENKAFAEKLAAAAAKKYPGLCLGVRVKDGRYNQFLHPQAILVEIGGVNNHRAEALYAARLLADILADVLLFPEATPEGPRGEGGGEEKTGTVEG